MPSLTMDVPAAHLILASIATVTASMRRNSRWSRASAYTGRGLDSRNASGSNAPRNGSVALGDDRALERLEGEDELMAGFVELRRQVMDTGDLPSMSAVMAPFLSLIRSPLTTGPITSHALNAVLSLLPIFAPPSPPSDLAPPPSDDLTLVLSNISFAVTHCKFEASDSQGDEVVLLKMLAVIGELVKVWGGSGGAMIGLGDKEVCEMLETGLGMCCQMRLSELLRRTAESTVQGMVRIVFSRLTSLEPSTSPSASVDPDHYVEASPLASMDPTGVSLGGTAESPALEKLDLADEGTVKGSDTPLGLADPDLPVDDSPPTAFVPLPFSPYGSATTTELIRVLISLLNPSDQQHTDSMRLAALSILNTALETAGTHIGLWDEMRTMLSDEGCKYLLQLTRSDAPNLLSSSLRTTSTLFSTLRLHLKPQLELFLSYLIDRLTPPPSAIFPDQRLSSTAGGSSVSSVAHSEEKDPSRATARHPAGLGMTAQGETRDLLLEALMHLASSPEFLVDLWVNFDCDMDREDLFEKTVAFLTRGVYPSAPGAGPDIQSDAQSLCLMLLLKAVENMAERVEASPKPWPATYPTTADLSRTKDAKRILLVGAARFNQKPKTGLAYLEEHGLLISEPGPERSHAVAVLLKSSPKLDKKLLGDYISRPDNIEILKKFIRLFNFKDKLVADAMRDLLEAFRLPGESQQINRIAETFAEIYFATEPAEIKSQDAVYVLAYSIIMLNTDQFSPQVRKRMAFEDYQRNIRGVNADSDFSESFVRDIYDSIKKREIIMPEEHTGQLGFEYAWKEMLSRAPKAGPMLVCDTSMFDAEMFKVVSKQVVSAIAYAFTTFNDDYAIQRAITGFRQCATLAGKFDLPEVFDNVVMSLSQTTGLLDDRDPSRASVNNPVVDVEGQSLTVSALSVRFGLNFKAQTAAVVLFTIANGNGNSIREGWSQVFEMYQTLFLHSLLPTPMLQMEDFLGGTSMIPLQVAPPANARDERRSDSGLLSTLSSYLLSPYASSADQLGVPTCTDDEIEATLSTVDCLGSCRFEELYSQIVDLELEPLLSAIRALKDLAERSLAPKAVALPASRNGRAQKGNGRDTPTGRESPMPAMVPVPYDPSSVFLLEMLVSLTSQAKKHITEIWPIAFEHLSQILGSAGTYSVLLIERAVVGLLRLCVVISTEPSLRDQLYVSLDLLRSLPGPVIQSVSEQLIAGVAKILEQDASLIKSQTEWGLVLSLVRAAISHPEASKVALTLVERVVAAELGPGVTADNFSGVVAILSDFAVFGGTSTAGKQQRGRRPVTAGALEPAVERGLRAVDALFGLKDPAAALIEVSSASSTETTKLYRLPPLKALGSLATSPSRDIRTRSLSYLQRTLPGSHLVPHDLATLTTVFNSVLFPMLDELLKPQVFMLDPQGMEETRLRANALLCRVFLVYLSESGDGGEIEELWIGVIDVLDRLMNSGKPDQLYEAIPESLKNLLLVLNSSNILLPPANPDLRTDAQKALWVKTFDRIERFLPTFCEGLFPPPPPLSETPPAPAPQEDLQEGDGLA